MFPWIYDMIIHMATLFWLMGFTDRDEIKWEVKDYRGKDQRSLIKEWSYRNSRNKKRIVHILYEIPDSNLGNLISPPVLCLFEYMLATRSVATKNRRCFMQLRSTTKSIVQYVTESSSIIDASRLTPWAMQGVDQSSLWII